MEKILAIILMYVTYILGYRLFLLYNVKKTLAVIWPVTVAVMFVITVAVILPAEAIRRISGTK